MEGTAERGVEEHDMLQCVNNWKLWEFNKYNRSVNPAHTYNDVCAGFLVEYCNKSTGVLRYVGYAKLPLKLRDIHCTRENESQQSESSFGCRWRLFLYVILLDDGIWK